VVGAPDDEWGEVVTAFVVPAAGGLASAPLRGVEEELRALFDTPGWAPKRYHVVEQLPMLPNGKIDRLALQELV
jgi:O-succinylbenzoic acid--CoA ligase